MAVVRSTTGTPLRRWTVLLAVVAAVGGSLAACAPPPPTPAAGVKASKVLVVVEENHSLAQMQSGMPYLFSLAKSHAYATNYTAIRHPSEPNYIAIAAGSTLGDTSDHNPAWQTSGQSVFGQAVAAGRTAKVYAESMTSNCQLSNHSPYAVKHNPWPSFSDERSACQAGNVPAGSPSSGALHNDIQAGTLPNAGMLVPNLDNDAHDGSLGTADTWLKNWLGQAMAGPDYRSGRLVIVVTADEDNGSQGNKVLTVLIHPNQNGQVVTTALDHYSLAGFYDAVLGTPRLRNAASAPNLAAAFGQLVGP